MQKCIRKNKLDKEPLKSLTYDSLPNSSIKMDFTKALESVATIALCPEEERLDSNLLKSNFLLIRQTHKIYARALHIGGLQGSLL